MVWVEPQSPLSAWAHLGPGPQLEPIIKCVHGGGGGGPGFSSCRLCEGMHVCVGMTLEPIIMLGEGPGAELAAAKFVGTNTRWQVASQNLTSLADSPWGGVHSGSFTGRELQFCSPHTAAWSQI